MRKHTKLDNMVSFVIGASLAVPFTMYAINNPSKPVTYNHNHTVNVKHEIVTIEETIPPKASDTKTSDKVSKKTSNKKSDKKYLGRFKITAYCPCSKCCGKANGITASGTKVKEGRTIAVDPKIIPLGSKVELNGKTYVAEDVGGAIKGNSIDLYFNSHSEANNWGVKYKNVYLIKEAN